MQGVRLPHNIEAEQQILGALLMRDDLFFEVAETIRPEDFFDHAHGAIFHTIEALVQGGKRVTITLVRDFIGTSERSQKVETPYLEALMDAAADYGAVADYAKQIGDLARRRRLIVAMQDGMSKISQLDPLISSQSVIDDVESSILDASRIDGTTVKRIDEWAAKAMGRVIDAFEYPDKHAAGMKWGLTAIDNTVGPLQEGDLVVMGGRPGSGKSALAGQFAEKLGEQEPGFIQSLEMEGEDWAERAMSQGTEIAVWRIRRAKVNEDEIGRLMEAARRLRKLPVWIDHKTRLNVAQIRARAIRMKHKHRIKWMIVDHGHIIQPSSRRLQPAEATNENFYELKQIAKDLQIGVVVLAQMNKEVRARVGGRPRAGDLMYYSSVEPHADAIFFPHRPEIALAEERPDESEDTKFAAWKAKMLEVENKAEIINAKARFGKAYQVQQCEFIGPLMKFRDLQERGEPLAQEEMEYY